MRWLFQRRHVVPAERSAALGGHPSRVGDETVDERDVRAVQTALVDERTLRVARDEHFARETRGGRVGRGGVARVTGRRQRDRLRAQILRARDCRGLAARLEGVRGVERLVLDEEAFEAQRCAERSRVDERRESLAERHRRFAVEERHQLAIAPHVRRAADQRVARPAARPFEIVAREQGSAAPAEKVPLARIEQRRAARHGAFEVREEGHAIFRGAPCPFSSATRRAA
jgi:hypothetical protein